MDRRKYAYMMYRFPEFWMKKDGLLTLILAPLGWMWATFGICRTALTLPFNATIPIICIGNVMLGGTGKTPIALSIANKLYGVHFLSRGYGGSKHGPILVDPKRHDYSLVGDEPLILTSIAPCWVSKNRIDGAKCAVEKGATCLILDDGFQNSSLKKDVSFLVVDGHVGFGNFRCIPAGPLREPVSLALARANAVIILGEDRNSIADLIIDKPVLRAKLEPEDEAKILINKTVVAFAGIGRPKKFFQTLETLGAKIAKTFNFPDHHPYKISEIDKLIDFAKIHDAILVTTTKDIVRIPFHQRDVISVLRVKVIWEDEVTLMKILHPVLSML
ncbi:MAG: tetraacyldisaccharide 4'-kinase [Rhodospirillaceae bacterium]|jgi:tetraacyldisaccharide 4'-kinase|nr:tetraacyldisaccharide 4'-kinase [Rhodospirillaceae bacterium]